MIVTKYRKISKRPLQENIGIPMLQEDCQIVNIKHLSRIIPQEKVRRQIQRPINSK